MGHLATVVLGWFLVAVVGTALAGGPDAGVGTAQTGMGVAGTAAGAIVGNTGTLIDSFQNAKRYAERTGGKQGGGLGNKPAANKQRDGKKNQKQQGQRQQQG